MINYKELKYGFEYGCAQIERLFSDNKNGWVTLGITTPKSKIQVYITKTGKVRVYKDGAEIK